MFYRGIIVVCPTIHSRNKKYTMNAESRHFIDKPGGTESDQWEILRIKTLSSTSQIM
jgi:hypothetical protein